jgi:hypothetical protein
MCKHHAYTCRGRLLEKDMKKEARAKIVKAFVSTGRTGRGIVPLPASLPAAPEQCVPLSSAMCLVASGPVHPPTHPPTHPLNYPPRLQCVCLTQGTELITTPAHRGYRAGNDKKSGCDAAPSGRKPWKGTNPSAKGRGNYGCLSSIPYVPCPETKSAVRSCVTSHPFAR